MIELWFETWSKILKKNNIADVITSIDTTHPLLDFLLHAHDFVLHNSSLKEGEKERIQKSPVRARARLSPSELDAVQSLPFRYNFWASHTTSVAKLKTIFVREDFFDRFALDNLGFSFANRDWGTQDTANAAGWYVPMTHYLNIKPDSGMDIRVVMLHEYVHAVDFGTRGLRSEHPELKQEWDDLWRDGHRVLWNALTSPFENGYKDEPLSSFPESTMLDIAKDAAAKKTTIYSTEVPAWFKWQMFDKLRDKKFYLSQKEEMIARLGSMFLYMEYGRIQNDAGRAMMLKEQLHTDDGITEEKMGVFMLAGEAWAQRFEHYIKHCNEKLALEGEHVGYLNYLSVDLREVIESFVPVDLRTNDVSISERYHNLYQAVKNLLHKKGHISFGDYTRAVKPFMSDEDFQNLITKTVTRGSVHHDLRCLASSDSVLEMVLNRQEGRTVYAKDAALSLAQNTFYPLLSTLERHCEEHPTALYEKIEIDGETRWTYFDVHDNKHSRLLKNYVDCDATLDIAYRLYMKLETDEQAKKTKGLALSAALNNLKVKISGLITPSPYELNRLNTIDKRAASYLEKVYIFNGTGKNFVPNTMVDEALKDCLSTNVMFDIDYRVMNRELQLFDKVKTLEFLQLMVDNPEVAQKDLAREGWTTSVSEILGQTELLREKMTSWGKTMKDMLKKEKDVVSDEEKLATIKVVLAEMVNFTRQWNPQVSYAYTLPEHSVAISDDCDDFDV